MHDYSMDRHPKEKILFWLAFAAIMATPYINAAFTGLEDYLGGYALPITGLSVFIVFRTLFWVFDRHLWKYKFIRKVLLMPDLNGRWVCEGRTDIKNGSDTNYEWVGEINITQSWSKIIIRLKTKNSESLSTAASIRRIDSSGFRVLYVYENDPKKVEGGLTKHDGTADVTFNFDCEKAEGNYYTDEHRGTVGALKLRRHKNEL